MFPRPAYLIAYIFLGQSILELAPEPEVDEDGELAWMAYGHRRIPYWTLALSELCAAGVPFCVPPPPKGWHDHFRPAAPEKASDNRLLLQLGLLKPVEPIRRRV